MRTVFLGTPEAAVPSLTALAEVSDVVAVVTRPDRPRGRSKRPVPSPIKEHAERLELPVHQPGSSAEIAPILAALGDLDVAVIVAYGMLIRPDALAIPDRGFVNVHFSILPRWRGAAPVQRAIEAADGRTGVTLMRLDPGLDTGPIYSIRSTELLVHETAGDVLSRLATTGAGLVQQLLGDIVSGRIIATPQPPDGVTHAAKISTEERRLDPATPAEQLVSKIHALSPSPGSTARLDGQGFKILRSRTTVEASDEPGALDLVDGRLLMSTATTRIELVEVQPAGKRPMSGRDWALGRRGTLGALT